MKSLISWAVCLPLLFSPLYATRTCRKTKIVVGITLFFSLGMYGVWKMNQVREEKESKDRATQEQKNQKEHTSSSRPRLYKPKKKKVSFSNENKAK